MQPNWAPRSFDTKRTGISTWIAGGRRRTGVRSQYGVFQLGEIEHVQAFANRPEGSPDRTDHHHRIIGVLAAVAIPNSRLVARCREGVARCRRVAASASPVNYARSVVPGAAACLLVPPRRKPRWLHVHALTTCTLVETTRPGGGHPTGYVISAARSPLARRPRAGDVGTGATATFNATH